MNDAIVSHPTVVRVLASVQSLGAVIAALLILAGLAFPLVVTGLPLPRWLVRLDAIEWALITVSGIGIAAAAFGMRTRVRSSAGWASLLLGVLVLWIIVSSVDARWVNHLFRDTRTGGLVTGLAVARVGAVLAIISGWSATRDTPPGWLMTGLTGISIGLVEPDPGVTTRDRLVLLFGPSVLIVSVVLAIILVGGTPGQVD